MSIQIIVTGTKRGCYRKFKTLPDSKAVIFVPTCLGLI